MIPGHPHETKQLDELRSRQRFMRPLVLDVVANSDSDNAVSLPNNFEVEASTEIALRTIAQEILDRHKYYLDQLVSHQHMSLALRTLNRATLPARSWCSSSPARFQTNWKEFVLPEMDYNAQEDLSRRKDLEDALLLIVIADKISIDQEEST